MTDLVHNSLRNCRGSLRPHQCMEMNKNETELKLIINAIEIVTNGYDDNKKNTNKLIMSLNGIQLKRARQ